MVDRLLLRPTEAAEALGISRARVYRLIKDGIVPVVQLGRGAVRVPVRELTDLIETLSAEMSPKKQSSSDAPVSPQQNTGI